MSSTREQLEQLNDRQLLIRVVQLLEELLKRARETGPDRPVPPPHHTP